MTRFTVPRSKKPSLHELPSRKSARISTHRSTTDSPAGSDSTPTNGVTPLPGSQTVTTDRDLLQLLISQTSSPSLKERGPVESHDPHKKIFDLEEVPTFYPTEDQFLYPDLYLASLRPHAERFGMCKIVPPQSFNPQFAADIENLKFQPEVQRLHQIGARSRKPSNFFEKLKVFHEQNGLTFKHPFLYSKTLDLYQFVGIMNEYGGYERVVADKKWAQVGRDLGYNSQGCTSISFGLRNVFESYILSYQQFISQGDQIRSHEEATKKQPRIVKKSSSGTQCALCRKDKLDELIVNCDQCDRIFHGKCLQPALEEVFDCSFFCPICLDQYDPTFGFDQGSEYTITEFMRKDLEFKKSYLRGNGSKSNTSPATTLIPDPEEHIIERRFWSQVSDYIDELSVEYCSDLQASDGYSGFPTLERCPDHPLSKHPWNLNNIATHHSNLLSHIQDKSLGMSVPWIYIGMMLSAFCWHNEDHFTYSLNYQHWGSPRTCYSVPAHYAEKFEDAFKEIAPAIFEKDPEILYQLVTMLSPADLITRDIPVYRITQRPGEFIVTFPRAFYCGFNHGLNYTEAVNFSSTDWLPHGLECVLQYQDLRRMPVFCHDELLFHVAEIATSLSEASPLHKYLIDLRLREEGSRAIAQTFTQKVIQLPYPGGVRPSDIPQCTECNVYCFMSAITCSCFTETKKFVCTSHIQDLCHCAVAERQLAIFMTYDILDKLIEHIAELSKPLITWQNRYVEVASSRRHPELTEFESLVGEATTLVCFIPEALEMEKYVQSCREWSFLASQALQSLPKFDPDYSFRGPIYQGMQSLLEEWKRLSFNSSVVSELRLRVKDLKLLYKSKQKVNDRLEFTDEELNKLAVTVLRLDVEGESRSWLETLAPELFIKKVAPVIEEVKGSEWPPIPLEPPPSVAAPPENGVKWEEDSVILPAPEPQFDPHRPSQDEIDQWINLCTHVLSGSLTGKHANLKDRLQSIVASTEKLLSKPTLEICICNNPSTTKLLVCSECKVGYHKVCIKPRKLPGPNDHFLCPICDPLTRGSIQRKRPNFLGITKILSDAPNLAGYVPEYDLLHRLAELVSVFQKCLEEELKKGARLHEDRVHLKGIVRLTQALEVNLQSELTEFIRLLHPRSSSPKRSARLDEEGSPPPKLKNRKKSQVPPNGTLVPDLVRASSTSSAGIPMMIKLESHSSAPVLTPLRTLKPSSLPAALLASTPSESTPSEVTGPPPDLPPQAPPPPESLLPSSPPPAVISPPPRDPHPLPPPPRDPPLFSIASLVGRPLSPRPALPHPPLRPLRRPPGHPSLLPHDL